MKNKILAFILMLSLVIIPTFKAESVFSADANVKDEGDYVASRFVAGNKVESTSTVDGISFVAGESLSLNGSSEFGFYAGNNITVDGSVLKDAFIAGNSIKITSKAYLGRDVYIAGNDVVISTNIQRDLRAGGNVVDISGITINGNASIYTDKLIMDEKTVIKGKLTINEDTNVKGLDLAEVGTLKKLKVKSVEIAVSTKSFMDYVYDFVISVAASFATLALLFYIVPSSKKKLDKVKIKPGKMIEDTLIGLAVLVATPIIAIIAMFTGILFPISIISLLVYGVCIYLSMLFVFYIVGKRINKKVFKGENEYASILCGIVIVKLITFIPYVGGIVKALSLFYGLGLAFRFIVIKKKKKNNQATA